jgi:hypothetical protein
LSVYASTNTDKLSGVLNPPPEVRNDPDFLAAHGVRILMLGNPTFAVAV